MILRVSQFFKLLLIYHCLIDGINCLKECGSDTRRISSHFNTPGYPGYYPNKEDCFYIFYGTSTFTLVNLNFHQFALEANCIYDFFLLNGVRYCSHDLQNYTGTFDLPLYMEFKSDSSDVFAGVYATYALLASYSTRCNASTTLNTGEIFSQGYPKNYPANINCWYIFDQRFGFEFIEIQFHKFQIPKSDYCVNDGLIVENKKYCGSNFTAKTFKLPLKIGFVTTKTGPGFYASYTYLATNNSRVECDSGKRKEIGVISSPEYPDYPKTPMTCFYNFSVKYGCTKVKLNFLTFDLKSLQSGSHDGLFVNGTKFFGKQLENKTETYSLPLSLKFVSNGIVTNSGFLATYIYLKEHSSECDETIESLHGIIKSPDYPEHYKNNLSCHYEFKFKEDYPGGIALYFVDFSLQSSPSCLDDSLEINGNKHCGEELKQKTVYIMPSDKVIFHSDGRTTARGFFATFKYLEKINDTCYENITSSRGVIQSPGFPRNYDNNITCRYEFQKKDEYHSVVIDFIKFRIVFSRDCTQDKLVMDGHSYCGDQLENKKVTKKLPAELHFTTDGSITDQGFLASYHYQKNEGLFCDKEFEDQETGFILPPKGKSGQYPERVSCSNRIHKLNDSKCVKFNFVYMKNLCELGDYIEVDGLKYCQLPDIKPFILTVLYLGSEIIPVDFVSDRVGTTSQAFIIKFEQKSTDCPQKKMCQPPLTTEKGNLYNPNYPMVYPKNYQCEYVIKQNSGSTKVNFILSKELETLGDKLQVTQGDPKGPLKYNQVKTVKFENPGNTGVMPIMIEFKSDNGHETTFNIFAYQEK